MGMKLSELLPSWRVSLRAANRSPRTVDSYMLAANQLIAAVGDIDITEVTTDQIRAYLAEVLEKRASATARQRYASLRQFFKWAVEEGELAQDPMVKVKPPKVIQTPPDVIELRHIKLLIESCVGSRSKFTDRRDEALIRVLADTGLRLGELMGLKLTDLDLEEELMVVVGKGRREREIHLSRNTILALDRYLRERRRHEFAGEGSGAEEWLWLGGKGRLRDSGVNQMLARRCERLGLPRFHPHQFRHTLAHEWLINGGQEHTLMSNMGWSSSQMVGRYGASAAAVRGHEEHRRLGLGNRV